jgi:hypothetical protein
MDNQKGRKVWTTLCVLTLPSSIISLELLHVMSRIVMILFSCGFLPYVNLCPCWHSKVLNVTYRPTTSNKVKLKAGVAQRVPGGLGSQISMIFGTWKWWGCQPHAPAAFTFRKYSWYSFSLEAELTPGPWYVRKEYVTESSSDTTGNRSGDRPTSSAAL